MTSQNPLKYIVVYTSLLAFSSLLPATYTFSQTPSEALATYAPHKLNAKQHKRLATDNPQKREADGRSDPHEYYNKLPLSFTANHGQTDSQVKFLSRGRGYSIFFTPMEAVMLFDASAHKRAERSGGEANADGDYPHTPGVLRMRLCGGNPQPDIVGSGELKGKINNYVGSDPNKWQANVPLYGGVEYRSVYDGINLKYYGNQDSLKYDLTVAPGADPRKVAFEFSGSKRIYVAANGDLVLQVDGGEVQQPKPYIYQDINGTRRAVAGRYALKSGNRVGFEVGNYDTNRPLVIDPEINYSTNLGGNGIDRGSDIAVDANGYVYVVGHTNSSDFPLVNAAQSNFNPNTPNRCVPIFTIGPYCTDVYVTKLDPTLSSLIYSTYIGGLYSDEGYDIAVDAAGNAYVTGNTESPDFPLVNALQTAHGAMTTAFAVKLGVTGNIIYSTFLGEQNSSSVGVVANSVGEAYFLVTSFAGDVIYKLNQSGSSIVYSTNLDSADSLQPRDIAIDPATNIYVTGVLTSNPANYNVFVGKLDGQGGIVYSLSIGGGGDDIGSNIAADYAGYAYVTGSTSSADFPTTSNAFQRNYHEGGDAYVTGLGPTGQIVYSTFIGGGQPVFGDGNSLDYGSGIAVDDSSNVYVTGRRRSSDFPLTPDAQLRDGLSFFFKLDTNASGAGALVYSTTIPGDCNGVAYSPTGDAYVVGDTSYALYPTTSNAFQPQHRSYTDAFITAFSFQKNVPPLIFVPGIAGSRLVDQDATFGTLWPGVGRFDHEKLTLDPLEQRANIIATDAIRSVIGKQIYRTLLDMLVRRAGYREYQINDLPSRRTAAGCDYEGQKANKPNLFVFAYDWPLSNVDNANRLADYVQCVRKFYPNTDLNIIGHSMGGLLARRYILQHHNDHHVKKLITINSPLLGAPKAIAVLETGDFIAFVMDKTIKKVSEFFPGMHQLLPSRQYYDISQRYYGYLPAITPFLEEGWDINSNGIAYEAYTYDQQRSLLNARHPRSTPGTTGNDFHETQGQDDWRGEDSGVEYHHIVSTQARNQTIGDVRAWRDTICSTDIFLGIQRLDCKTYQDFKTTETLGDGTVPLVSQDRGWLGSNGQGSLNAPGSRTWYHWSLSEDADDLHEHTGITQNPSVHELLLHLLDLGPQPPGYPELPPAPIQIDRVPKRLRPSGRAESRQAAAEFGNRPSMRSEVGFDTVSYRPPLSSAYATRGLRGNIAPSQTTSQAKGYGQPPPPMRPSYYLTITGVDFVSITDAAGNTNRRVDGTLVLPVPNVSYTLLGNKKVLISMPTTKTYTITFHVGENPVAIELLKGLNNVQPTMAIKYQDLKMPAGAKAMIRITPEGGEDLRYDGEGDGLFETSVTPTVNVTGAAARDVTPPALGFSTALDQAQTLISIAAVDEGAGVKAIYYSLDGASFQLFTAPFKVDPAQMKHLYAFADDNMANRSSLATFDVPVGIRGRVTDAQGNAGVGVTITLNWKSNGVPQTLSKQTDENGEYYFSNLARNVKYTVTPAKADLSFDPPKQIVERPSGNQTINFTLSPIIATLAVRPILECVQSNAEGDYTAHFGYKNNNSIPVGIDIGDSNQFAPGTDRGQTKMFEPGRIYSAFSVQFDGSRIMWTLLGPDGMACTVA